jgi:hypothetical protein
MRSFQRVTMSHRRRITNAGKRPLLKIWRRRSTWSKMTSGNARPRKLRKFKVGLWTVRQ